MLDLLSLPEVALVREIAQARGVSLILVGGAVRDALLDKPVHDLDFAVQGNAVAIARAIANRLGAAFYLMDAERGTARVIVRRGGSQPSLHLDFAACRGATWDEDLRGRDFTINAIALDIADGEVLDPTGGLADVPHNLIRQVSPHAVSDDPVRALRAVRLECALRGTLEPATAATVSAAAPLLGVPSPERVRDELMKALALPAAARAVRRLDALGLLARLVPEIEPMRDCTQSPPHHLAVLEHTFLVLDYVDEMLKHLTGLQDLSGLSNAGMPAWLRGLDIAEPQRAELTRQLWAETANDRLRVAVFRLAALLHDIAKPATRSVGADGRIHFYRHEEIGAAMAAARAAALRLSGDEVEQVRATVRHHMRPNQMSREYGESGPSARAIYRFVNAAGACAPELALFCVADGMGKAGAATPLEDADRRTAAATTLIKAYYDRFSLAAAPRPLLSGADMLALGVKQGPRIGQILGAVREAQMVREIQTKAEALQLARSLLGLDH